MLRSATVLVLIFLAAAPRPAVSQDDRPNIIFIITDDQRWDSFGAAGHPFARTPNLDRLAREGAMFTEFFVTTPLCSPSRASFLTGQYASEHRVYNNDKVGMDVISHTLMTFPRRLRESGYETAFIGKWHMGLDDTRRPGFDHWISFKGQGLYIDPVVNDNGERRQLDGYMTDYLNEKAVEFVDREHTQPFLLFFSHKAVHYPYMPAERHDTLYADQSFAPPASFDEDLSDKPVLTRDVPSPDWSKIDGVVPEPGESRRGRGRDQDSIVLDQLRALASVDEGIGMLLDALEASGELDDTVIIFASDNGYLLGEHGQFDTKRFAYEPSIRAPFLMRYPELIEGGTRVDEMVLNIDLAPTLVEMAGAEPLENVQGRSFLPLLAGGDVPWRESFMAEHYLEKVVPRAPAWKAVRTERWKYIHFPELEGMDELYDLQADPQEVTNLIGNPDAQPVLAEMKAELVRLLQEID